GARERFTSLPGRLRNTTRGDHDRSCGAFGDGCAVEIAKLRSGDWGGFGVALALDGEGFAALCGDDIDSALAGSDAVFDAPAIAAEPAAYLGFELGRRERTQAHDGAVKPATAFPAGHAPEDEHGGHG